MASGYNRAAAGVQGQNQAPQQHPGCDRTGNSQSNSQSQQAPAVSDNHCNTGSSTEALLCSLADDVYCYAVRCIVSSTTPWSRKAKASLAALSTFALQIVLVILVWEGLVKGSDTNASNPETDKLWRQVGQVQRQVCWLNKYAMMNKSAPLDAELNCSGALPQAYCKSNAMGYSQFQSCVETLSSRLKRSIFFWSKSYSSPPKETAHEFAELSKAKTCEGLTYMGSSDLHFGVGLLFPNYLGDYDSDRPPFNTSSWQLSDGGWSSPRGKLLSSHQACMTDMPAVSRQDPSLVNLVVFLALAVYVHEEITKAVWLAYVAAACAGILPEFYAADHRFGVLMPNSRHICWNVVIVCAPLLQFLTGLLVLSGGMAVHFAPETQGSIVNIILGNVSLSFILDLDNRVGAILASQGRHTRALHGLHDSAGATSVADAASSVDAATPSPSRHSPAQSVLSVTVASICGHVYMATLGLLLSMELVCWSPWVFRDIYEAVKGAPQDLVVGGLLSSTLPYPYFSLLYRSMQYFWAQIWAQSGPTVAVYQVVYPFAAALFVFLLYGDMLPPTAAHRFGPVLLTTQMLTAGLAATTWQGLVTTSGFRVRVDPGYEGFSTITNLTTTCSTAFFSWLGMFVLWPLLHRKQPRDCKYCSGCGSPCAGCPLFPDLCPGQCCCKCYTQ